MTFLFSLIWSCRRPAFMNLRRGCFPQLFSRMQWFIVACIVYKQGLHFVILQTLWHYTHLSNECRKASDCAALADFSWPVCRVHVCLIGVSLTDAIPVWDLFKHFWNVCESVSVCLIAWVSLSPFYDFVIIRSYLGGGQLWDNKTSRCDVSSGKVSEQHMLWFLSATLEKYKCDTQQMQGSCFFFGEQVSTWHFTVILCSALFAILASDALSAEVFHSKCKETGEEEGYCILMQLSLRSVNFPPTWSRICVSFSSILLFSLWLIPPVHGSTVAHCAFPPLFTSPSSSLPTILSFRCPPAHSLHTSPLLGVQVGSQSFIFTSGLRFMYSMRVDESGGEAQMLQQPYSILISHHWGRKDLMQHNVSEGGKEEKRWREERDGKEVMVKTKLKGEEEERKKSMMWKKWE